MSVPGACLTLVAIAASAAPEGTAPRSESPRGGDSVLVDEVRQLAARVEALRGQHFGRSPVAVRVTSPMREVAATIRVQRVLSPEQLDARGRAWDDVGLGDPKAPRELWSILAQDLDDVGFDPDGNRLLVAENRLSASDFDPEDGDGEAATLLMMTGVRPDEPLFAHLLLHARQRERSGGDHLARRTDELLAASAWAEGEANLAATLLLFAGLGLEREVAHMKLDLDTFLGGRLVPSALASAQGAVGELAAFVYHDGYGQAAGAYRQGGWEALERAMRERRTTRDVLHGAASSRAQAELEPAGKAPREGLRLVDEDSLGEVGVSALVALRTGKDNLGRLAAEGWLGDRLRRWEAARGIEGFTEWRTRWASEEEAAEFRAAFERGLRQRFAAGEWREWSADGRKASQMRHEGRAWRVEQTAGDVVVSVAPVAWLPAPNPEDKPVADP